MHVTKLNPTARADPKSGKRQERRSGKNGSTNKKSKNKANRARFKLKDRLLAFDLLPLSAEFETSAGRRPRHLGDAS